MIWGGNAVTAPRNLRRLHGGKASEPNAASSTAPSILDAAVEGQFEVRPDALCRTASGIGAIRDSVVSGVVDAELLVDDVVGHPGLAAALREFAAEWDRCLAEYRDHLGALGEALDRMGRGYQAVDAFTAEAFAGHGALAPNRDRSRGGAR
jgi:hypothetical protein